MTHCHSALTGLVEKGTDIVVLRQMLQPTAQRPMELDVEGRCGAGVSKSQVSRLCGELDERVGAFLNRQIEGDWPYLVPHLREPGRAVLATNEASFSCREISLSYRLTGPRLAALVLKLAAQDGRS